MTDLNQLISAVQVATKKLVGTGHFDDLLKEVLDICVGAVEAQGGTIYLHDPTTKRLVFRHVLPEWVKDKLPTLDIADDYGIAGQAFQSRQTAKMNFPPKPDAERNPFEIATGITVKSIVATPLLIEGGEPIGVVQLLNKLNGEFGEADVAVLDIIASVSTLAYFNHRLTEESSRASTLLGMGKVSHDIGNLAASLYANVSFTEMSLQELEDLAAKEHDEKLANAIESLKPMHTELKNSVDRIVGYSRLVSDMSAGRKLRPRISSQNLSETIHTAASYLESEARLKHIKLNYKIETDSLPYPHDELFVFRITQNLVGNAIKAVQETVTEGWLKEHENSEDIFCGEVSVIYGFDLNRRWLEIVDTGPGMSNAVVEKILHGNARSQWDKGAGSGWGMKIVLELAQAMQAEVQVDSTLGEGSTFRIIFPNNITPDTALPNSKLLPLAST